MNHTYPTPLRRWLWLGLILLLAALVVGMAFTAVSQASAAPNLITGTITDPLGGLPPANTIAQLITPDGAVHGSAAVDEATGAFSLGPVANGNYVVRAKPPAGSSYTPSLPHSLLVTGSSIDVGTLALTTPDVTGTVFAPDNVTPTEARVNVYRAGHLVQSDLAESGDFQLGGLITGTYTLQAVPTTNDPYWHSPRQPITITPGVSQTVDLFLEEANVAGVIVDPNGVPVPGAVVHVVGLVHHVYRQDVTNASGYFAIGNLSLDAYVLRAEPPWTADGLMASAPQTFTVPPDFQDLGQIALRDAPKVVEGFVETNTGVPVENALIVANRLDHPGHQEALSQGDGSYRLHLSGGLWSLTVRPTDASNPAHWLYPQPPQLVHFDEDLEPEAKTVNFTVLTADSHVVGSVEMPDGSTPPFTVTVGLRTNEGIGRYQVLSPGQSSFDVQVPHGNYVLTVQPHDPSYAGPPPQPVYAPENDTLDVGALALVAKDATLSGHVTDGAGNGIEGVRVVGWTTDHQGAQTRTNPDGSYALAVTPGEWLIKPQVPPELPYVYEGRPLTATVASMEHVAGLDFELTEAPNQVVGQLVNQNGDPVHAQGWATAVDADGPVNGAPIDGGHFTIYLPDGAYDVAIKLAPGSVRPGRWLPGPPQPVTVAGGETVTLTVPLLPQNATIAGALWDPRNEVVVSGVNGQVMAHNPFAWVGDAINPANGTYKLGVSAGLWHLGYSVAPDSGYVALDHHKIVPIEAGQTLAVPLPVAERDSILSGVVLQPNGSPLAGAVVAADGLGSQVNQVTLRALSDDLGHFRLAVPHGVYRLRAAHEEAQANNWLNPALKTVIAPPNGSVSGITLAFRESDATLTGVTSIEGDPPVDGRVHIWAYSSSGAATKTSALLGESYSLNLIQGERWHIGAVLETEDSFYGVRTAVFISTTNQTLDLTLNGPHPKPGPVVVTFDAAEDQELALSDGTRIFIPAGAMPVSGEVTLHITPIATFPHQHHARLYKYGYAFIATDETGTPITSSFNQNVIIRFSYDESALDDLDLKEAHLKPAYFSTSTQSWTIPDSYVVDTAEDAVTMQIDHFTDFSLLGSEVIEVFLPVVNR